MNILFATSELTPLAKTGGLGDVLAALPARLRDNGHSVSVVLPGYRAVFDSLPEVRDTGLRLTVPLGPGRATARILEGRTREGVKLLLVGKDEFFDRRGLYGNSEGDYTDNAHRFIFFSKVVVELAGHLRPRPEVLHLNDWQTAFAAAVVRQKRPSLRTVLTIHNLAYQGVFAPWDFDLTNLPGDWFHPGGMEFYGRLNLLKAGLVHADALTTVSPSYATEIQTPEFGCGLEGVLRGRSQDLNGILNGIDEAAWNPATDAFLRETYGPGDWEAKKACRARLLKAVGLDAERVTGPVFACISRLVPQKGLDLVAKVAPELAAQGGALVVLGSGLPQLEKKFLALAAEHPESLAVEIGFNEKLAHRIEAGADFFLMPSRFEPCGLNQMYSQRYGTIPIVHRTGGLADSVEDWRPRKKSGTGIVFAPCTTAALSKAIRRAFLVYGDPVAWDLIRRRAMARDFSWSAAAKSYEQIYRRVCGLESEASTPNNPLNTENP
ncbi:MAG: glycogen synthase GlgA [Candidatus Methylacidiphilales bacterium]|nr:glycogen synthase GlgA [Candidatus Methylacidiphilales bacterium]